MTARLIVLCVCSVAVAFPSVWASDAVDAVIPAPSAMASSKTSAALGGSTETGGPIEVLTPKIGLKMPEKNREQITLSFQIALDRVREVPECAGIFTELGADGAGTIGRIIFYPIGRHELGTDVCRGRVANTIVGGGPVWLCRGFSRLTDTQAAMIIIHEALHHAGLTERPRDPKGMTSAAINDMVLTRCGL
jgi:hypothetical protein